MATPQVPRVRERDAGAAVALGRAGRARDRDRERLRAAAPRGRRVPPRRGDPHQHDLGSGRRGEDQCATHPATCDRARVGAAGALDQPPSRLVLRAASAADLRRRALLRLQVHLVRSSPISLLTHSREPRVAVVAAVVAAVAAVVAAVAAVVVEEDT